MPDIRFISSPKQLYCTSIVQEGLSNFLVSSFLKMPFGHLICYVNHADDTRLLPRKVDFFNQAPTVCQRRLDPFYFATYNLKLVKTYRTYSRKKCRFFSELHEERETIKSKIDETYEVYR